jgi:hypothetical protein
MPLVEAAGNFRPTSQKAWLISISVTPGASEGSIGLSVLPLSIHNVDRDPITGQAAFPDQQVLAQIRPILAARSGKPMAMLLAEQEARRHQRALSEH